MKTFTHPPQPAPELMWHGPECVGPDGRVVGRVLWTGLRWIARIPGRAGWCDLVLDGEQEARDAVEQSAALRRGEAP